MLRPTLNVAGITPRIRFMFVYPHQILSHPITDILEKNLVHPVKETLHRKWGEPDTSSMWTFIRCPMYVQKKAHLRAYERRRLRHALAYALKLNGLDKAGRRHSKASPEEASSMEPLIGSLRLLAAWHIGNASIDDLIHDCQSMLAQINDERRQVYHEGSKSSQPLY
jgi:hypothetical protein